MKKTITKNLEKRLKESNNIDQYLENHEENMIQVDMSAILNNLISKSSLKKSDIIKQSGIATSYAYEILNGFKIPTRDKVLRFLIALQMDFEDVQTILKKCSYPTLYIRMKRDSIIIFAITNHKSVVETNIMLDDRGLELI